MLIVHQRAYSSGIASASRDFKCDKDGEKTMLTARVLPPLHAQCLKGRPLVRAAASAAPAVRWDRMPAAVDINKILHTSES